MRFHSHSAARAALLAAALVLTATAPGPASAASSISGPPPGSAIDSWSAGVCTFARLMAKLDPDFGPAAEMICGRVIGTEDMR